MNPILESQRQFFNTNATKNTAFRIKQLKKLKIVLKSNEQLLFDAIYTDFKKSAFETYTSELGLIYKEIDLACKKLKTWAKPKKVKTNLLNFPAKSYIIPEPLGTTLIIGAWNYPYYLSFAPTVASISAGNTVILKPSELPIQTSSIMAKLINSNFKPDFFKVIEGGIPQTTDLLNQKWDKIFFTGSTKVGKIVNLAAAKNLTPVVLELGGKSPAIITKKTNLKITVKRLIWAKFLNAGQTCIAPDYVFVHKSIKKEFLKLIVSEIEKTAYKIENKNYVQIINSTHFNRLKSLLENTKIYYGGQTDLKNRIIYPTILSNVSFTNNIMKEEIFGPILPILTYDNLDKVIQKIKSKPKPLACYLFTNEKKIKNKILTELSFGGGTINDSVMHITNPNLPFGGVQMSGTGSYHGKFGFKIFSHYKSILEKTIAIEPNLKYTPYSLKKLKWIKKLMSL